MFVDAKLQRKTPYCKLFDVTYTNPLESVMKCAFYNPLSSKNCVASL